jgi:hypothetical protein
MSNFKKDVENYLVKRFTTLNEGISKGEAVLKNQSQLEEVNNFAANFGIQLKKKK